MPPQRRIYPLQGFKVAINVGFCFFLIVVLPKAGGSRESLEVIGSKPPACGNKCMKCRPCIATLVAPNHKSKGFKVSSHREDVSYYLLSWKCICGDKLFQP